MAFALEKAALLQRLAEGCDYSPKGNIDAPILSLVELINADPRFVTTSTCSGRVSVFASSGGCNNAAEAGASNSEPQSSLEEPPVSPEPLGEASPPGHGKGGIGRWVLASHAPVSTARVEQAVDEALKLSKKSEAVLKHEPSIMHVRCVDLNWATWLLKVVVGAGFRESGIVPGRTKVMLHVRTTATCLEVPLILNGEILVTPSYLSVLTDIANRRFALNAERLQRLEDSVRTALAALPAPSPEDVARTTSAMAQPGAGWSAAVSSSSSPASTRAVATTPTTITSATATVETAAAAARETTLAARAAIAAASGKSSASSSLVSGPPLPGSKAAGRLAKSARVAAAKASAKALKRAAKLNSNSGNTNTGISGRSSGSSSSSSIVDDCRLRSNIRNHELSSTIPDEKLASVSSRTVNENPEWAGPGWAASVALLNSSSKLGEDTTALDNNSRRDSNSEFDPCQWTILSFGGFGPCQDGGSVRRLSACKTLRGTTCDYKVAAGAPMNVTVASATVADTAATGAEPCPREGSALATLFECGTTSSSDADPLLSPMAVLFGGRESPTKPLGDAWCWREDISLEPRNSSSNSSRRSSSGIWRALRKPSSSSLKSGSDDHHHHLGTDVAGEWPCPRWGHTLTSVGPGMLLLLGGRDHLGTVGINKNGSEDDIRDGRGAAYLLIAHCEGNIIKDGWRWERLSVTATAGADATNFSLARFDHSATLVPTAAANRTFKGAQATSTVVVYGGWHDAAVDVQPSASLLVLDLKIDFNDGKQIPKVDVCEVRRLLCVAHRWSMLVASKDERMNMLRRASHAAVALVTHFVVFGGAGDITAGDDSLSAFALPWAPLLCQDGDHNDSMVLAEAIQWANESHSRSGGGFLEAFVKGSAVPLPPAPPAPWSTLMSPGSLSSTPHEVTNATNSSKSNGGSQASSSNSMVVNAAAWAVGTPPCSARGEQRALLLGGGLPLLGFGPHFCAHTSPIASCVTLRFASGYGESFSREDRATSTGEASLAQNSSTIASSSNRMVHTAWLEPMSLIGETSSTKAPPESSAHADGAASPSVSWAASVRARSRRKQGAAAVAQSGQSAIPAVLPASLSNNAVGSRTIAGATTQKNNMHVDKRESNTGDVAPCEVLAAPSNATKKLKAALEASGFLHKGWRIAPAASAIPDILAASTAATSHATSSDGESTPDYAGWLALPLTDDGAAVVDAAIAAIAAMSNAANDAAAGCDKAAAQAAAEASGASSKLAAALVGAMQSAASTITKAANLPDGPDTGASSNSGDSTFSAHFSLWSSLLRGRAVDGGLPLNKAKLFGQRSKLESAVVALLLEAHRCDLSSDSNNNNNIKQTEAALRKAVLSSSLFAGNTNLERVGDTAILLPETCLPPSELAQWPWSLLSASLNDACSSEGKGSSSCSQKLSSNGSETPVDGPGAIALLWKCIATSHNVRLIARAARIDDGPKRASRVRLLYAARLAPLPSSSSSSLSSSYPPSQSLCGVDEEGRSLSAGPHSAGWCSVREHGISFSFDITRVMFCSGNVTERKRMAAPPTSFAPHAKYGEATQLADRPANAAAASATSSTGPASATAGDAARPKHSTPSGPWDALLPSPPQSASQACVEQQARCAAEGGEVIVDLYGGIGYYTLPFLVHFGHKVKHLHACEWNPDSIVALRFNIDAHNVASKCTVYPGDNRLTVHSLAAPTTATQVTPNAEGLKRNFSADSSSPLGLRGCADRVNLGLIPSSSQGWPLACAALKPRGGWLHVHDNVHEDAVVAWVSELAAIIAKMGAGEGEGREKWQVVVAHVEKVKSYAPRVMHVVADLFVYQQCSANDGDE